MKNTILIVEDELVYQEMLGAIVKALGYNIEIRSDGLDAIYYMQAHHETTLAVLLDIYMPQVDGISTLGQLRNHHPDLPVIVISATEDNDDERVVKSLGAVAFIQKPFTPKQISDTLEEIFVKLVSSAA